MAKRLAGLDQRDPRSRARLLSARHHRSIAVPSRARPGAGPRPDRGAQIMFVASVDDDAGNAGQPVHVCAAIWLGVMNRRLTKKWVQIRAKCQAESGSRNDSTSSGVGVERGATTFEPRPLGGGLACQVLVVAIDPAVIGQRQIRCVLRAGSSPADPSSSPEIPAGSRRGTTSRISSGRLRKISGRRISARQWSGWAWAYSSASVEPQEPRTGPSDQCPDDCGLDRGRRFRRRVSLCSISACGND